MRALQKTLPADVANFTVMMWLVHNWDVLQCSNLMQLADIVGKLPLKWSEPDAVGFASPDALGLVFVRART